MEEMEINLNEILQQENEREQEKNRAIAEYNSQHLIKFLGMNLEYELPQTDYKVFRKILTHT